MFRQILLLLVIAGSVTALSTLALSQIEGLQKLLKGDQTAIATCKIVFFKELVDYNVADEHCKSFEIGSGRAEKGNLVTVNTDEKNQQLQVLLDLAYPVADPEVGKWGSTRWVWAGLRKTKNTDDTNVQRGDYDPLEWEWADGTNPTEFQQWLNFGEKNSQPDQDNMKKGKKIKGVSGDDATCNEDPRCFQNQMRINHEGAWDDTYKFRKHPYACDYRGKYILSSEPSTWKEAGSACDAAGLHLAMVRSPAEVEEIKTAMVYFLGDADVSWGTWDANNWIWLSGNDVEEEGVWRWYNGDLAETWDMPWRNKAGKDNAKYLSDGGQNAMAISRWGEFDDSFQDQVERKRPFACQCPDS